jgi:hypothetical protein
MVESVLEEQVECTVVGLDIASGGTESILHWSRVYFKTRRGLKKTKTINDNGTSDNDNDTIHIHDNQYRPLTSTNATTWKLR